MRKLNVKKLDEYVGAGLLTKQKHPEADLYIWNYTPECQYKRQWDKYTMMCRGLITDGEGNIIARPFKKFFNWDEPDAKYPKKSKRVDVYEKMDGSLGILYWIGDTPWIATRGSFTSEQAIWSTCMFRKYANYDSFDKSLTYLFEIIARWNRIVVDYPNNNLTLLAIYDRTGKEYDIQPYQGQMQTRTSRNEPREYICATKERMEAVQTMSSDRSQERQRQIQREAKSKYKKLEEKKQETIKGVGTGKLLQDQGDYRSGEKSSLQGLRPNIPPVCDGFRPREGYKGSECRQMQESQKNISGDSQMRCSVCELPQDTDLDAFEVVYRYPYRSLEDVLAVKPSKNREGFVIRFANGTRIKFKFEEYKRLHKLITGFSVKAIWEMLKDGQSFEEILSAVPDEFYQWVEKTANELIDAERIIREDSNAQYAEILDSMPNDFESDRGKRKFFALKANQTIYPPLSFALWDGKLELYNELIWDLVKPKFHRVFKLSTEEV